LLRYPIARAARLRVNAARARMDLYGRWIVISFQPDAALPSIAMRAPNRHAEFVEAAKQTAASRLRLR
jgi:hypothetical protein